MSEILAAVAREQLRGYPRHLKQLRDAVNEFSVFLEGMPGLSLVLGSAEAISCCSFTQIVLRVDETLLGIGKAELMAQLTKNGIPNWHANFELINSLSFFRSGAWRDWILRGDVDRVAEHNGGPFPVAEGIFAHGGLGLGKTNFLSSGNRKHLQSVLQSVTKRRVA
jgi:dTDP-4-amino-4,6-dideoxygalactose transaminase